MIDEEEVDIRCGCSECENPVTEEEAPPVVTRKPARLPHPLALLGWFFGSISLAGVVTDEWVGAGAVVGFLVGTLALGRMMGGNW